MTTPPTVYFTCDEVVIHNKADDIWVIVHKMVFELTNLIKERSQTMSDFLHLLVQYAGKDLSWAFTELGTPLERINQYFENVPVFPPISEKESDDSDFWWRGDKNIIGRITCLERSIRIINTLSKKIMFMNVCEEDTLSMIQKKYSQAFNRDARNYVWRKTSTEGKTSGRIFMEKTLTQNGILYEKNEKLGLPPAIWLYFVLNKD